MLYILRFHPSVKKDLANIPDQDYIRIKKVLSSLESDPFLGKKLWGEYKGYYSIRVWPYRIVYTLHRTSQSIIITAIGYRQGIYK